MDEEKHFNQALSQQFLNFYIQNFKAWKEWEARKRDSTDCWEGFAASSHKGVPVQICVRGWDDGVRTRETWRVCLNGSTITGCEDAGGETLAEALSNFETKYNEWLSRQLRV